MGARSPVQQKTIPRSFRRGAFQLESDLLETFGTHLKQRDSPFRNLLLATEFDFTTGRSDLLGFDQASKVVAFEAKLDRWRTAVHQAYRNASFADLSFVVLPERAAATAMASQYEFGRRNIGLISVSELGMEILLSPEERPVLRPQLRERAVKYVKESNSRNPTAT